MSRESLLRAAGVHASVGDRVRVTMRGRVPFEGTVIQDDPWEVILDRKGVRLRLDMSGAGHGWSARGADGERRVVLSVDRSAKPNPSLRQLVHGATLPFRHAASGLRAAKRAVQSKVPFALPNPAESREEVLENAYRQLRRLHGSDLAMDFEEFERSMERQSIESIKAEIEDEIRRYRDNPRKNPSKRTYRGHVITGAAPRFTVQPYGRDFSTLTKAKAWIDDHVRRESARANPSCRAVKRNPAHAGHSIVQAKNGAFLIAEYGQYGPQFNTREAAQKYLAKHIRPMIKAKPGKGSGAVAFKQAYLSPHSVDWYLQAIGELDSWAHFGQPLTPKALEVLRGARRPLNGDIRFDYGDAVDLIMRTSDYHPRVMALLESMNEVRR